MATSNRMRAGALGTLALALLGHTGAAHAQLRALDRLPVERLAVEAPSVRVLGAPGDMRVAARTCRAAVPERLRQRVVDIAVQEWGFFGFGVVDQTRVEDDGGFGEQRPRRRRVSWLGPAESARVAGSIAGYWTATGEGSWILERQNATWNGPDGIAARWRDPWSAAFISWVMCESGLGDTARFRRAIAHHAYIDQAIEARDDPSSQAAYIAYDVGEQAVEPGDMLCSARRSAYRSIDDRRGHLGVGVRSHCDIVVKVDAAASRILAIGGNVRGAVSLKLLPASFDGGGSPDSPVSVGIGRRAVFAHLKLRAAPVAPDAFDRTPTLEALDARSGARLEERLQGEPAPRRDTES